MTLPDPTTWPLPRVKILGLILAAGLTFTLLLAFALELPAYFGSARWLGQLVSGALIIGLLFGICVFFYRLTTTPL